MAKHLAGFLKRFTTPVSLRFLLAFSAAALSRLALFALAVLLARRLGPSQYGIFTFAIGAATAVSNLSTLGWPNLFNRLFPSLVKQQAWSQLKGLAIASNLVIAIAGLLGAIALLSVSAWSTELSDGLVYASLLIIPLGLILLRKQQLSGVRQPALGLLFDQGFAAFVTFLTTLLLGIRDLAAVVGVFFVSSLVGVLCTSVAFRRILPREVAKSKAAYELRDWFKMALPMSVGTLSKNLFNRMDVLMLAPLATVHEVGLYGAAWRLTYLFTFPQVVLMTVVTPMLSEAYAHRNHAKIHRLMRLSAAYAWVTTLPPLAVILIAPSWVMQLVFGAEFAVAGNTLMLLGLAQFASAFVIANSALLMMADKERTFGVINFSVVLVSFALNAILIPIYARNGAAVAALVTSCLLLSFQYYYSHKLQRNLSSRA